MPNQAKKAERINPMEESPILEFNQVCMHFGGVKAVDNLSFQIHRGEIVGVIGPNGAGKTTVFNVLSGVYIPTSGDVVFKGNRINNLPAHRIIASGIARTFQNIRIFGSMSVLDNVLTAFYARTKYHIYDIFLDSHAKRMQEADHCSEAEELLSVVGLKNKASLPAGSLPYGDQRRLEIARALATKPEVLLLDEPGAGMNPNEIDELNRTILLMKEKFGLTILLVEHQMRLVMGICERIVVMNFGKSLAVGTPNEIRNHKDVLEAYLGKGHSHD